MNQILIHNFLLFQILFESLKTFFNMVKILMVSAKLATLGILKK